jgi:glutamate racemase
MADKLIGIFDSGVGGLSVLRAVRQELPKAHLLYVADQARVPYGSRTLDEVRSYSEDITRYLLLNGAQLIVVACNTASAAALHALRRTFPTTPFVGMEPAVKPAAEYTRTGVVGVLATPATFQGALYSSVVERFAGGVKIVQDTCPGLVKQIEAGELDSSQTRLILEEALNPMLAQGIDTVVLGCTHYPFVIPIIEEIAGPTVRVIDPAPAVARQVRRVYATLDLPVTSGSIPQFQSTQVRYLTTGDVRQFERMLHRLTGVSDPVEHVLIQSAG